MIYRRHEQPRGGASRESAFRQPTTVGNKDILNAQIYETIMFAER